MLPKIYRLPLRAESDFFQEAEKLYNKFFIIYFKKTVLKQTRAAVVVTKKTEPKAVDRNKIKRKLRAALLPTIKQTKGLDLMVLANKATKSAQHQQLIQELKKTLAQITKQ